MENDKQLSKNTRHVSMLKEYCFWLYKECMVTM